MSPKCPLVSLCTYSSLSTSGYSAKAKVQASVRYCDQSTGQDLDPDHHRLINNITSRLARRSDQSWCAHGCAGVRTMLKARLRR